MQPGKRPEEKEDDKGQKHSDGGQQCPQEAELQRVGENAISGLGDAPSKAYLPHKDGPRSREPPHTVDKVTGGMGTGGGLESKVE